MKNIALTTLLILTGSISTMHTPLKAMERGTTQTINVFNTAKKPIRITYAIIDASNKEEVLEDKIKAGESTPIKLKKESLLYQMSAQFEGAPQNTAIDVDLFDLSNLTKPTANGKIYFTESKKDTTRLAYELEIGGKIGRASCRERV